MAEVDNNPFADRPAGEELRGVVAKCVACHHEMHTPVVCDYCHTLNPITGPTDYFQLLGLPRRYDLDPAELRRKYLALNRHIHPDFHTGDEQEVRDLSLSISSSVNDAYRTLADPVARAEYLVELLGGKSSAQDKSVPEGFLGEIMTLREELEQAKTSGDSEEYERMRATLRQRVDEMVARLGEMFGSFDTTVPCEGLRLDELARIRQQLNAISYVRRLLA